eukprot:gb/GEZN01037707.1/.p2 GENE.gb/GEZN01037707.1/~~gb/GEZN01037707.1/.p2  ORF type:complete len:109 (-),score=6.50 gb/GEZN01037707.1/:6-332(-)
MSYPPISADLSAQIVKGADTRDPAATSKRTGFHVNPFSATGVNRMGPFKAGVSRVKTTCIADEEPATTVAGKGAIVIFRTAGIVTITPGDTEKGKSDKSLLFPVPGRA